jgi:hypothetical protein
MRTLIVALLLLLLFPTNSIASRAEITYPDNKTKGVVLLLHGGGWMSGDEDKWLAPLRPDAQWFNRQGWTSVNYTYAAGRASIADVADKYMKLRARWPNKRICAYGQSAGGHLALMLAARFNLDCVISIGAPTQLETWHSANTIMGDDASPANIVSTTEHRRILLVHVVEDAGVDIEQARKYVRTHAGVHTYFPHQSTRQIKKRWLAHGYLSHANWMKYRCAIKRLLKEDKNV